LYQENLRSGNLPSGELDESEDDLPNQERLVTPDEMRSEGFMGDLTPEED
jgi:hypothetical protein